MKRHNWASEIRMFLCKFGFESEWLEQCVPHRSSFIDNFKENLKEHYIERWQMQLNNSSELAIYSTFKLNFAFESYFGGCLSRQLCITFARFRSSCLPLEIENGRQSGISVQERVYKFCEAKNSSVLEDNNNNNNNNLLFIHTLLNLNRNSKVRAVSSLRTNNFCFADKLTTTLDKFFSKNM
jgi:hypothetical protein